MSQRTIAKKHFMSKWELRSLLLFSALLMGAALAAHAQGTALSPAPSVQMATVGVVQVIPHNKVMTRDVEDAFNRADTNHDGKLSREEAGHFPAVESRFDQIDTNHDGFISRDEFNQAAGSDS